MRKIFSVVLLLAVFSIAKGQSVFIPYNYQFYQKFDQDLYSTKTNEHTSLKPYFEVDSTLRFHYDSILN